MQHIQLPINNILPKKSIIYEQFNTDSCTKNVVVKVYKPVCLKSPIYRPYMFPNEKNYLGLNIFLDQIRDH